MCWFVVCYDLLIRLESQESIRPRRTIEGFIVWIVRFLSDEESSSRRPLLAGVLVEFADGPFGSQACQPFLPKVRMKILVIC